MSLPSDAAGRALHHVRRVLVEIFTFLAAISEPAAVVCVQSPYFDFIHCHLTQHGDSLLAGDNADGSVSPIILLVLCTEMELIEVENKDRCVKA